MTEEELAAAAAEAVARIGRQLGAEVVPEGADPAQLLAPAAALRVSRQVELAARREVGVHIRRAREDGLSWHEIGGLVGFGPLAADADVSVASYAFDYTVGPRSRARGSTRQCSRGSARRAGRMISDRGPVIMPAADEAGHADGCGRLAAAMAEWQATG
jgi:hypothetical protein